MRCMPARFGETFVELSSLTLAAFREALAELDRRYETLYASVLAKKAKSGHWAAAFIDTMLQALRRCRTDSQEST